LDPFAGAGTTLIEGQRLGRNTVGIELQAHVADGARRLVGDEPNSFGVVSDIITGDSQTLDYRAILSRHNQKSVQLVIMHPPYFDIIKFSDDARDLSNAADVTDFLEGIATVVERSREVLDRGRYLVLVIGDKYAKGEWIPLGFMTMNEVAQRGFLLKSIVVKNFDATTGKRTQKELWRYRALAGGFYIFKHEYIFIFKKR
jgi:DNA modification methylase